MSGYGESETGLEMSEDYLSTVIRIELLMVSIRFV